MLLVLDINLCLKYLRFRHVCMYKWEVPFRFPETYFLELSSRDFLLLLLKSALHTEQAYSLYMKLTKTFVAVFYLKFILKSYFSRLNKNKKQLFLLCYLTQSVLTR